MQRVFALLAALAQMTAPGWIARNDARPATRAALGRAPGAPASTHASRPRELRSRCVDATAAQKALGPRRFARSTATVRQWAQSADRAVAPPPPERLQPPPFILRI